MSNNTSPTGTAGKFQFRQNYVLKRQTAVRRKDGLRSQRSESAVDDIKKTFSFSGTFYYVYIDSLILVVFTNTE